MSEAAASIGASMERIRRERERDRIRAEVLADLVRGGSYLLGRQVVLAWPDGLPGGMTKEAVLRLLDSWAGHPSDRPDAPRVPQGSEAGTS